MAHNSKQIGTQTLIDHVMNILAVFKNMALLQNPSNYIDHNKANEEFLCRIWTYKKLHYIKGEKASFLNIVSTFENRDFWKFKLLHANEVIRKLHVIITLRTFYITFCTVSQLCIVLNSFMLNLIQYTTLQTIIILYVYNLTCKEISCNDWLMLEL